MKNNILKYLILTIFLISLNACKINENKKVVIKFWAMGIEGENVKKIAQKFNSENPDFIVEVQSIPWTAAQEKLLTAFASDNLPDVFQIGNTWIPQFYEMNAIEKLDNYIAKSKTVDKNNYFEGIWVTNLMDEGLYGIPWYVDTRIMFYRKDLFEKVGYKNPPKSWQELYDICEKIKKYQSKGDNYAIYLPSNEWATFVIFALQNNATLLKNDNQYGNFNSPEFEEAFLFLTKFHKNKLAPIGLTEVNNVYQAFNEGYFAIYISGPWNVKDFYKWVDTSKWATAPLPSKDGKGVGVSLAGGSSLVISHKSKYKNYAWEWIEYLSSEKNQIEFYKLTSDLPANKKCWDSLGLSNDKVMKAFYQQFHNVVATPKIPEWEQIVFGKLQQAAEYAIRGKKDVKSILIDLDNSVNQILEKRRWLISKAKRQ